MAAGSSKDKAPNPEEDGPVIVCDAEGESPDELPFVQLKVRPGHDDATTLVAQSSVDAKDKAQVLMCSTKQCAEAYVKDLTPTMAMETVMECPHIQEMINKLAAPVEKPSGWLKCAIY